MSKNIHTEADILGLIEVDLPHISLEFGGSEFDFNELLSFSLNEQIS